MSKKIIRFWDHRMAFMSFIGLQTFKVKLFSGKSLWSNILNYLQTKVTPKNPHSCIFFSMILKKWEFLTNFNFFSFRLADDQKSFNAACNNIFLHFCACGLLFYYFEMLVFFLLIKLQEEFCPVIYHLCWTCTSNKQSSIWSGRIKGVVNLD